MTLEDTKTPLVVVRDHSGSFVGIKPFVAPDHGSTDGPSAPCLVAPFRVDPERQYWLLYARYARMDLSGGYPDNVTTFIDLFHTETAAENVQRQLAEATRSVTALTQKPNLLLPLTARATFGPREAYVMPWTQSGCSIEYLDIVPVAMKRDRRIRFR